MICTGKEAGISSRETDSARSEGVIGVISGSDNRGDLKKRDCISGIIVTYIFSSG